VETPRLLPDLALVAPGGALVLRNETWRGGAPRSLVVAERGSDGYRDYRFSFARDVTGRIAAEVDGEFRKADAFTVDSYRAFSPHLALQARVRPRVVARAGFRRHASDEYLLDRTLQARFSHEASETRGLLYADVLSRGFVGQAYRSSIHSDTAAAGAAYAALSAADERSGLRASGRAPIGPALLTFAIRGERREAEAEGASRGAWTGAASAGWTASPAEGATLSLAAVLESAEGERTRASGEGAFAWNGLLPVGVRLGRAHEERAVRAWIRNEGRPGVVRYGEVAAHMVFLPAKPTLRYFRREGDDVDRLQATDAYQEASVRVSERTDGIEISAAGERTRLAWEGSYTWARARENGSEDLPPYHSDHLARGRVSYTQPIPRFPAVPRLDLLCEWRSERRAPGRTIPMEDYFYLRGRVTIALRGVDLFGQMEQLLGHQNEYLDGAVEGGDGVLSGTRQIHLGLSWPLTD
jgi:hypothetical protein